MYCSSIIAWSYRHSYRSIVEYGAVIWHSGLTKYQSSLLEKVQKVALKIILAERYQDYETARSIFNLPLLSERRIGLCTTFALKLYKSNRAKEFFEFTDSTIKTRHQSLVKETLSNTTKCYNAPHKSLARIVNACKDRIISNSK